MRLLFINQIRKAKKNLYYIISISLLLFITTFIFTAFKSSLLRTEENYQPYLEQQRTENFYMFMNNVDVRFLGATAVTELCQEYNVLPDCALYLIDQDNQEVANNLNTLLNSHILDNPVIYENVIDDYMDTFELKYNLDVEKTYTSDISSNGFDYRFVSVTNTVSIPYIVKGETPRLLNEIALYPEFAKHNNIEIGDDYNIDGETFRVTAYFYAPDYLMPVISSTNIQYDETIETLVLASTTTIRNLDRPIIVKYKAYGDSNTLFNDIDYNDIYSIDYSRYGRAIELVDVLVPAQVNVRISALYDELNLANSFVDLFVIAFIILSSIILLIFMRKYIKKNKKDIEVLHSIGYTNKELSLSLMTFPAITTISIVLGYLFGLLFSNTLFKIYSSRYYFPKSDTIFSFNIMIYSLILPILFILLVSYLFILLQLKDKKQRYKKSILKYSTLPKEFLSFVIFVIISILLLFGLNSNSLFDTFKETTTLGNHYDKFIFLKTFTNDELNDGNEGYTRIKSIISIANNKELDDILGTSLYGIDENGENKILIDDDPLNNQLIKTGFIISRYMSESNDIGIGDVITLEFNNTSVTREVLGISNELFESSVFMDIKSLNEAFSLDETYYNGIYTNTTFTEDANVKQVLDYDNTVDEMITVFNISSSLLRIITTISILLALFIFVISLYTYIDDNIVNISTFRAMGYDTTEVLFKYLKYSYFLIVIGYAVALPISTFMIKLFGQKIVESVGFILIVESSPILNLLGFILLQLLFIVLSILFNRYINKTNISEKLKQKE